MIYHDACTFRTSSQTKENLKLLTAYMVAYKHSLIDNVTSWATCFVVSVPAQEFHFSPTPKLYMQNVNLGSRLQAKYFHIYIPIYIYAFVLKLPESKYVLYIHINMHI